MKKILRFISSMGFAVGILIMLGIVSIGGTLIPQGAGEGFYLNKYGESIGGIILKVGLDNAYFAWWYVLLTVLLLLNLFFCVVVRIRRLYISVKKHGIVNSSRLIGSWTLHVAILLLVIFFGLGNLYGVNSAVYDVPGEIKSIPEFNMKIAIDDFRVILREDQSVQSYESDVRIMESGGGEIVAGTISVNHPIVANGVQFSQASYGFAVDVVIEKNGEHLGQAILYQGEFVTAEQGAVTLEMVDFHPHYEVIRSSEDGTIMTMKNPELLYRLYHWGNLVGMDYIKIDNSISSGIYTLTLENPRMFTYLALRKDPFTSGVLVGAILLVLGLMLVFFGPEDKNKLLQNSDSEGIVEMPYEVVHTEENDK